MTLTRRTPLRAKQPMPRATKPLPKVSAKRRAYRQSAEGRANTEYRSAP